MSDLHASSQRITNEVVGLFRSPESLEAAISALTSSGWDRSELSLLAQKGAFDPKPPIGRETAEQAADDPRTSRAPVVSEPDIRQGRTLATSLAGVAAAFIAVGATVVTGGTALAAIIGAAAAGGGAAVAVEALGQWAGKSRADFLHEQIQRGGILLWVMLRSPEQEGKAREILMRHGADIIHAHDAELPTRPAPR
jgi:hypothetical protein